MRFFKEVENKGLDNRTVEALNQDHAEVLARIVRHLIIKTSEKMIGLLFGHGIIAWDIWDLISADVSVSHSFQLPNSEPISHLPRRPKPKWNEIIRENVNSIREGGIILPMSSFWSFPVVVAQKKEGKDAFYRLLNKKIILDRSRIPNMEEILGALQGRKYFTTMDLYSEYWQVPMHDSYKQMTTST